jgi:hypothetical protein
MTVQRPVRLRRDRYADWAVIAVLAVALLLGWAVKAWAEGQRDTFADAEAGITLRYPQGWFLRSNDKLAFEAQAPESGQFKTTYQVRIWPVAATGDITPTLAAVLNDASLARAQEGTAYRLFDIEPGKDIDGQPSMEATYVYVVESMDLFSQRMPVVVMGLDIALMRGDNAYVFSLLADKDVFDEAQKQFRRFVKSAEIQ